MLRAEERVQFTARPCVFVFVCVCEKHDFFYMNHFKRLSMSLSYNKQTVNCMANDTGSYIRVNLLFFFFLHVSMQEM